MAKITVKNRSNKYVRVDKLKVGAALAASNTAADDVRADGQELVGSTIEFYEPGQEPFEGVTASGPGVNPNALNVTAAPKPATSALIPAVPFVLADGVTLEVPIYVSNTGATTLTVNGGPINPVTRNGFALAADDLQRGSTFKLTYDALAAEWKMQTAETIAASKQGASAAVIAAAEIAAAASEAAAAISAAAALASQVASAQSEQNANASGINAAASEAAALANAAITTGNAVATGNDVNTTALSAAAALLSEQGAAANAGQTAADVITAAAAAAAALASEAAALASAQGANNSQVNTAADVITTAAAEAAALASANAAAASALVADAASMISVPDDAADLPAGATAISVATKNTLLTTTAGNLGEFTLAAGQEGQTKRLIFKFKDGVVECLITLALANYEGIAHSSISLQAQGDAIELLFVNGLWHLLGANPATASLNV